MGMWIVEVRHSSDHDKDEKWFEIDRCLLYVEAAKAARWFDRPAGYQGRPITIRYDANAQPAPAAVPHRPSPAGWVRALRRARRLIRS